MTELEILQKAVDKALANGWRPSGLETGTEADQLRYAKKHTTKLNIFDHDFARALWGDDEIQIWYEPTEYKTANYQTPFGELSIDSEEDAWGELRTTAWRYHLQQIVIADDPIQYLGEHLDEVMTDAS